MGTVSILVNKVRCQNAVLLALDWWQIQRNDPTN
jgi:hypothetical protein